MLSNIFLQKIHELSRTVEFLSHDEGNDSVIDLNTMERIGQACDWEATGRLDDEELAEITKDEVESDIRSFLFADMPDEDMAESVIEPFYAKNLLNMTNAVLHQPEADSHEDLRRNKPPAEACVRRQKAHKHRQKTPKTQERCILQSKTMSEGGSRRRAHQEVQCNITMAAATMSQTADCGRTQRHDKDYDSDLDNLLGDDNGCIPDSSRFHKHSTMLPGSQESADGEDSLVSWGDDTSESETRGGPPKTESRTRGKEIVTKHTKYAANLHKYAAKSSSEEYGIRKTGERFRPFPPSAAKHSYCDSSTSSDEDKNLFSSSGKEIFSRILCSTSTVYNHCLPNPLLLVSKESDRYGSDQDAMRKDHARVTRKGRGSSASALRHKVMEKENIPVDLQSLQSNSESPASNTKPKTGIGKFSMKNTLAGSWLAEPYEESLGKSRTLRNATTQAVAENEFLTPIRTNKFSRRITRSCSKPEYEHQELDFSSGKGICRSVQPKLKVSGMSPKADFRDIHHSGRHRPTSSSHRKSKKSLNYTQKIDCKVEDNANPNLLPQVVVYRFEDLVPSETPLSPRTRLCVPMKNMGLRSPTNVEPTRRERVPPKSGKASAKSPSYKSPTQSKSGRRVTKKMRKKSKRYDPCDSGEESDVMELQDEMLKEVTNRKATNSSSSHEMTKNKPKQSKKYNLCDSSEESDVTQLQHKMFEEMKKRKSSTGQNVNPVRAYSSDELDLMESLVS